MKVDNTKSRRERVIEGMAIWGSYYRENFDIFVTEYLQFDFLKWFQTMLLVMMNRARVFLWIAARGMGKSFLIAIFAVSRCILYPGTKVVITSGTRGQSINVLEKIQTDLMPVSPNLRNANARLSLSSSTAPTGVARSPTFRQSAFIFGSSLSFCF